MDTGTKVSEQKTIDITPTWEAIMHKEFIDEFIKELKEGLIEQHKTWRLDAKTMNKVYDILTSLTPEELKEFKAQVHVYYHKNMVFAKWMLYQVNYIEWKRSGRDG